MSAHPEDTSLELGWPAARRLKAGAWRPIAAMVLREMQARYGRSPGGWAWAFLEPLGAITLLALVFSLALHSPALGTSFMLFYASGYLPFMLCHSVSMLVMTSLRYVGRLLDYPRIALIDAVLARFLLNYVTGLVVMALVLGTLLAWEPGVPDIDWQALVMALTLAGLWALAIGMINAVLIHVAPVWETIWAVLTRPLFLVSGVLFLIETVPAPWRDLLLLNPITHIVALMRQAIYPEYQADLAAPFLMAFIGLVFLAIGLALLRVGGKDLLKR